MNVLLWVLQTLLALHTAIGAVWKWSNGEQTMPSLAAIPHAIWLGISVLELFCAVALIVPALNKRLTILAPIAAAFVAVEMAFFSGVHLASGATSIGPIIYWLVVAAICAFIIYGRGINASAGGHSRSRTRHLQRSRVPHLPERA